MGGDEQGVDDDEATGSGFITAFDHQCGRRPDPDVILGEGLLKKVVLHHKGPVFDEDGEYGPTVEMRFIAQDSGLWLHVMLHVEEAAELASRLWAEAEKANGGPFDTDEQEEGED